MFKELGFEKIEEQDGIAYKAKDSNYGFFFDKEYKEYSSSSLFFDMEVHKAIHKQLLELGWLDD